VHIPPELKYTKDHEWVRFSGQTARIGITDYAQDALGDVVFVSLPEVGTKVTSGESFSEVESTKSVSEIYAPLSGQITAINSVLVDAPETMNREPYGEGWLCEISFESLPVGEVLLDAEAYCALVEG